MKIGCGLGKFSRFTILYNSSYSVYCFSIALPHSSYKLSAFFSFIWTKHLQFYFLILSPVNSLSSLSLFQAAILSRINVTSTLQSVIFVATHINCNTQLIRMLTIAWTCLMTSSLPTSYAEHVSYINLACVIFQPIHNLPLPNFISIHYM